jgi:hypothetical protein
MTYRPQRVRVTIDRLVLRGFPPEQRDAIAAGLIGELQLQFADAAVQGMGGSRSVASLRAEPLRPVRGAEPRRIGAQAGRQLARSIRS